MNDQKIDRLTRQIELQRLIDGQMPALERAAFLQCIDEEPAWWREVALAYVEEQVIHTEIGSSPSAKPTLPSASQRRSSGHVGFIAAASVIVALLVGGIAGRWTSSIKVPPTAAPNTIVNEIPARSTESPDSLAKGDYYVLLKPAVHEPTTIEPSPWDYLSASMQQPIFGDETRKSIQQYGYDVHEEPVLFVVEDDAGGHYMIPQRNITFVSHEQQQ